MDVLSIDAFRLEVRVLSQEYKQHPEWAERTLAIVDAVGCALSEAKVGAAVLDAVRRRADLAKVATEVAGVAYGCVSTALIGATGTFKDLLVGIAATLRVLPEYVDALLSGAFALTSGGQFNPYVATITIGPPRVYNNVVIGARADRIDNRSTITSSANPKRLVAGGAGEHVYLKNLRWEKWGYRTARATGTMEACFTMVSCDTAPVTVSASDVSEPYGCGHAALRFYERVTAVATLRGNEYRTRAAVSTGKEACGP